MTVHHYYINENNAMIFGILGSLDWISEINSHLHHIINQIGFIIETEFFSKTISFNFNATY